jgi:hypothetical protein
MYKARGNARESINMLATYKTKRKRKKVEAFAKK